MSKKEKNAMEETDGIIVEFSDDEGNTYLYEQEMIIPVNGEKYAILVGVPDGEHEHSCGCECGCDCEEEEEDVIIAKIVVDADGEDEYIEPTDEEFEAVQEEYNRLVDEEEGKFEEEKKDIFE